MQAIDVKDDIKNVLFTKEEINAKVAELAARIDEDYAGKDVLLVGVLKGAIMVMADLSRALKGHYTMDWMAVSSYGGWDIEPEFVVGDGLDFAEKYRNLDCIATLHPHVYS